MNRWHIVTNGHLSRNKFWGEAENVMYHPVLATSIVIESEYGNILVDPSMDGKAMTEAVFNHCGLRAEEIDIIYSTHCHLDHWMGLSEFPNAKCYMAKGDLEDLRGWQPYFDEPTRQIIDRLNPAEGELVPGMKLIPLPGHTLGIQGLLFDGPEGKILVTGDAVMGVEFFQAKEGYFYSACPEQAAKSVEQAAEVADYIIPGHGNYFSVKAYPFAEAQENLLAAPKEIGGVGSDVKLGQFMDDAEKRHALMGLLPNGMGEGYLRTNQDISLVAFVTSMGLDAEQIRTLFEVLKP